MSVPVEFALVMAAPFAAAGVVWWTLHAWDRWQWSRDRRRREVLCRDLELFELQQRALEVQRVAEEIGWIADAMAEIRNLPTAAGR